MDNSQQYIDLCREATEIQNRWWTVGDHYAEWIIDRWSAELFLGHEFYSVATDGTPMINWVWLPRQDQLQDMIHDYKASQMKFSGNHGLIMDFASWVADESNLPCVSFEQLWLAFVMHEKFNKNWNGTTWEVSNEST